MTLVDTSVVTPDNEFDVEEDNIDFVYNQVAV